MTKDAFERIVTEMIDGIAGAGPLDAVYLDLHGAMVTEHSTTAKAKFWRACAR